MMRQAWHALLAAAIVGSAGAEDQQLVVPFIRYKETKPSSSERAYLEEYVSVLSNRASGASPAETAYGTEHGFEPGPKDPPRPGSNDPKVLYDKNVRDSAMRYIGGHHDGVEPSTVQQISVLNKDLSYSDGTNAFGVKFRDADDNDVTGYARTDKAHVLIITHGAPSGAEFLWPWNGENIKYSVGDFYEWLDAYTTAEQVRLTLIACGGALFAWRLMEHQYAMRSQVEVAKGQQVNVLDPNGDYLAEVVNKVDGVTLGETGADAVTQWQVRREGGTEEVLEVWPEVNLQVVLPPPKLLEVEAWGGSALVGAQSKKGTVIAIRPPPPPAPQTPPVAWDQTSDATLAAAANMNAPVLGTDAGGGTLSPAGPHPNAFKYVFRADDNALGVGFVCRSVDPPGDITDRRFIGAQVQAGTDVATFEAWPRFPNTNVQTMFRPILLSPGESVLSGFLFDSDMERQTGGVEQAVRDLIEDIDRLQLMMRRSKK